MTRTTARRYLEIEEDDMRNMRIPSLDRLCRAAAAIIVGLASGACSELVTPGGGDEARATVASALSASCAAMNWDSCRASVVPALAPGDVVDVTRFGASSEPGDDT